MSALPFTTSEPIPYGEGFVVEIHVAGSYWDHREFGTLEEANSFRADPLAQDREREVRAAKREEEREAELAR